MGLTLPGRSLVPVCAPGPGVVEAMAALRISAGVRACSIRSSFRDWAGDETNFQREVMEAALAHTLGNEAEQAYRRSDALTKRRELMSAWAAYVYGDADSNVVQLRSAVTV